MDEIVEKLLKDISSLPEKAMRLERLKRELVSLEPQEVARLLSNIYAVRKSAKGAAPLLSILVLPNVLKGMLGAQRYRHTYMEADRLGLSRVSSLFTDLSAKKAGLAGYDREDNSPMELVSLGRRRSMSKGSVKETLDRLLSDPDPVVITNLLNNPRITRREVVRIASMRPNSKAVLSIIATHRKWSKDYNVKKAMVMNPYTLPKISVALLETLLVQDVIAVSKDGSLHLQVKLAAMEILEDRDEDMV